MNTTINTTGNVTIDNSVGTAGDIVIVYNNSASPISIVDGTITTMRLAGTTTTGTRTVAARGVAFIYYVSATEVSVGGSGVT
jgi:lipopolysaccharide export system protein LptA